MRPFFVFPVLALSMLLSWNVAYAAPPFSESDLNALNVEHVRIVRQAQRACAANYHRGFARYNHRNPCVIGAVERHVRSLDRPALLRFHQQLPQQRRYDTHRNMNNVRRFFN